MTIQNKHSLKISCFLTFLSLPIHAVEVTVYNQDLGLIKENRTFSLKKGITDLTVTDVAANIDATSVHFKSLTSPEGVSIIEQNYQYDLINPDKLLEKYIGKEIELERFLGVAGDKREVIKGILLSNSRGRIIKSGGKIFVAPNGQPILPELPEGLVTKPTLQWKVSSKEGGSHSCEISYLTTGMNWQTDYVVVTNPKDDKMDLNAWVTINNNSGATYKEAKLKLVAGDVHRVQPPIRALQSKLMALREVATDGAAPQFTEKGFFEYHLYTLGRPTTLKDNETKQIEMAAASQIPLKKLFIYDGAENIQWGEYNEYYRNDPNYGTQGGKKVWVMLEFKNSKENSLGIPLPKGRLRVYKKDTDGSLQFIGEDAIDHTPKDEDVRVKMGNAFDLVGERIRIDFLSDTDKKMFKETFEIKLRNHKEQPVTVRVIEHLYRWTNWKIQEASQKWTKKDAQTIEFEVPVPKDGEAVVTYTVRYSW